MSTPADSVRVRLARFGDDAGLAAIDAAAWSPVSGFPSVIQAGDRSFFTPESPPQAHLVAELDGRLAGYLRLKPASRLPENAHVLAIQGLAVAPAARRQGVASALLDAAAKRASALGAAKLSLRVLGSNHAAIALYEEHGFEREGLLRQEFLIDGNLVDDVLMSKRLRPEP
ncbi:MAG TPA: GNAT family N-acetyltransferase [Streptosporangiaceae bacterium]